MKILVLNAGSSSLKCQYFFNHTSIATLLVERIGEAKGYSQILAKDKTIVNHDPVANHQEALKKVFDLLKEANVLDRVDSLDAMGHRVVHGGEYFSQPVRITPEVIDIIGQLTALAPLHNPANLEGIKSVYARYPQIVQVAVFDTAFHQTMPEYAYLYPLPYPLYETSSIRRYGFHGTSHAFVAKEAAKAMKRELSSLHLITLHLGNGASATAIQAGKSIDTSMGMTPLEGLMMGTRCGDIDPAIIPYLASEHAMKIEEIEQLLNKESGLKGICGHNDMREVMSRAKEGERLSSLALEMYAYRIKKYIGAYTVALGRVDAVVFTGGIGEHASKIREMICEGLTESIGLQLDPIKNEEASTEIRSIHHDKSRIGVWVIPTDEELEIAIQVENLLLRG